MCRTTLVPLKDKATEFHECCEALMSFLLRIVNARPGAMLNWLFKILFFIQEQGIAQNFYILVLVCDTRGGDRCKSSDAFIPGNVFILVKFILEIPLFTPNTDPWTPVLFACNGALHTLLGMKHLGNFDMQWLICTYAT